MLHAEQPRGPLPPGAGLLPRTRVLESRLDRSAAPATTNSSASLQGTSCAARARARRHASLTHLQGCKRVGQLQSLHLDQRVLLRVDALAGRPVVVRARLPVLRRVYGQPAQAAVMLMTDGPRNILLSNGLRVSRRMLSDCTRVKVNRAMTDTMGEKENSCQHALSSVALSCVMQRLPQGRGHRVAQAHRLSLTTRPWRRSSSNCHLTKES